MIHAGSSKLVLSMDAAGAEASASLAALVDQNVLAHAVDASVCCSPSEVV
jgi:hypothetical protein